MRFREWPCLHQLQRKTGPPLIDVLENNVLSGKKKKKKALFYSNCQFLWCQYPHRGQFQVTNLPTGLKNSWNFNNLLLQASMNWLQHVMSQSFFSSYFKIIFICWEGFLFNFIYILNLQKNSTSKIGSCIPFILIHHVLTFFHICFVSLSKYIHVIIFIIVIIIADSFQCKVQAHDSILRYFIIIS